MCVLPLVFVSFLLPTFRQALSHLVRDLVATTLLLASLISIVLYFKLHPTVPAFPLDFEYISNLSSRYVGNVDVCQDTSLLKSGRRYRYAAVIVYGASGDYAMERVFGVDAHMLHF